MHSYKFTSLHLKHTSHLQLPSPLWALFFSSSGLNLYKKVESLPTHSSTYHHLFGTVLLKNMAASWWVNPMSLFSTHIVWPPGDIGPEDFTLFLQLSLALGSMSLFSLGFLSLRPFLIHLGSSSYALLSVLALTMVVSQLPTSLAGDTPMHILGSSYLVCDGGIQICISSSSQNSRLTHLSNF
jgi:hypothetical protein